MSQTAGQQVYLIDEDETVRDSLKVLLESHGLRVQDFANGGEFMAVDGGGGAGCVVLGFNRHIAKGLELVAILRRRGATLPVIFIVGGGDASTRAAALASGANAYLERPVEEAALVHAVRTAFALQQGSFPVSGRMPISARS